MLATMQRNDQYLRITTLPGCCTGGGRPGTVRTPPYSAWSEGRGAEKALFGAIL